MHTVKRSHDGFPHFFCIVLVLFARHSIHTNQGLLLNENA